MKETRPVKTAIALIGYHARAYWRRRAVMNWLVLAVPLYIALALVAPPLQIPLRAAGFNIPAIARYEITGRVHNATGKAIAAVTVSVGGYHADTDTTGDYKLSFSSESAQRICVVFDNNGSRKVNYADAGPDNGIVLDEVFP